MLNYPTNANKLPLAFNAWKLIQNEIVELIHICLKPGESIESHINKIPVILYCVSGKGNILANEKAGIFEKGNAIYIESGMSRALWNEGVEDLEVIAFKVMKAS